MYKYIFSTCGFPGCGKVIYVDRELVCKPECVITLCNDHSIPRTDNSIVSEVLNVCERCEDALIVHPDGVHCEACEVIAYNDPVRMAEVYPKVHLGF